MGIDPESYYDELGHEEWERAEQNFVHNLEFTNTVHYLEKHLPEEGKILDAGGASGRYAVWLAERGYEVTLVDISRKQLDIAEEKLDERDLLEKVELIKGDIRDLGFDDKSFDAVMCLGGPLSHVLEEYKRRKAAEELVRVARKGSPVFFSVMGFYGILQLVILENKKSRIKNLEKLVERQKIDKELYKDMEAEPEFASTYLFKPEGLKRLMSDSGIEVDRVVGLENVTSVLETEEDENNRLHIDEEIVDILVNVSKSIRDEKASAYLSSHILGFGFKK